jgi:tetratricopeptide (TPR) repeat protein
MGVCARHTRVGGPNRSVSLQPACRVMLTLALIAVLTTLGCYATGCNPESAEPQETSFGPWTTMPWFTPSVETVHRRIASAWRRGNTEAQEKIAAKFARRRPDEPRAWAIWGNTRIKTRDYAGAEIVLREGLRLHPSGDPDLGWLLARALTALDRTDEARVVLQEQMRVFPESRLPYFGLLELAVARGDWDEAVRLADETAARTSANDYAGRHELAFALIHIPARRDEGISLLREIAPVLGEPGPAFLMLGTVLEKLGDADAPMFIAQARKVWRAPIPFEEALAVQRTYVEHHVPARQG